MVNANVSRTDMFSMLQVVHTKEDMTANKNGQDFSSHMNQAATDNQSGVEQDITSKDSAVTDKKQALEKMSQSTKKAFKEVEEVQDSVVSEPPVQEQVQTLVENVLEVISQIFDVSKEEIVSAMDAENMQPSSLLESSKLTQLVTKLTGNDNPMALLTDGENCEKLKVLLQAVSTKVETFCQQADITPSELQQQTEQISFKVLDESLEVVTITKEEIAQNIQLEQPEEKLYESHLKQPEDMTQEKQPQMKLQEESDAVKFTNQEVSSQPEEDKMQNLFSENEQMNQDEKQGNHNPSQTVTMKQTVAKAPTQIHQADDGNKHVQGIMNQFVETLSEKLDDGMEQVSASKIVRQVVDEIRVSMRQDTTSMELQLNPEHLGKVNINVSMKAGIVTAQIAVSDSMVKEALENQIQVLRDNMNQQGMKIDAVEVVIAGHGFEQNLEKGKQENEETAQTKKSGRRKLRVTELEESEVTEISEDTLKLQTTSTISYQA